LCPFQDCDIYSVGFPTKRARDAHIDAFHVASLLPQFSDLKPRSIWITLQEIIETDDEGLVEGLCVEATKYPGKPSGLVARAIAKRHFNSARILLRHFHGLDDLKDMKFRPYKLLSALAEADQVSLTREILSLCPTLGWGALEFGNALLEIIGKGHEDMVIFFLEQVRLRELRWKGELYVSLIGKAARVGNRNELSVLFDEIGKDCSPKHLARCCQDIAAEGNATALKQVLPYFLENFAKEAKQIKRFSILQHLPIDDAVMRLTRGTVRHSKNGEGSSFKSTFQRAALRGDIDELSRILELGIDINDISGQDGTALQAASRKGHVRVVQWLLERGAQVGSVGGAHGNAIAAAAATGHVEALEILLAAGQNASQEARANTKKGYRKTTLCLVSAPTTATPLHFAVAELQEETVKVLITAGADVTAIDSNGNTALHMCVLGPYSQSWTRKSVAAKIRRSSGVIAGLLLERGAIATAQNNCGNSPLHSLFIKEFPGGGGSVREHADFHPCPVQIAKLLFEGGASFDLLNKASISARDAAIKIGGQVLEDLKREIPTAWEGIYELVGGVKTVPFPLVEPPNDSLKNSSAGSSVDEKIDHFQEETSKLDDFDGDNMTSQMPDFSWNGGDTSETIRASYMPSDTMRWKATSSNETDIYSHSMIHDEYLTSNEINPSGNDRNHPSNHFYHPSFGLFMNPWEDTQA
jgi:ankyrin repeat protein